MDIDLKKNWPVLLAGLSAIVALILLFRPRTTLTQQPVQVGGSRNDAGFQAALQAQTTLEAGRQQTFASLFSSYIGGLVRREEIVTQERVSTRQIEASERVAAAQLAAETRRQEAEERMQAASAAAQLRAIEQQQATQRQSNLFGLISGALPFIFSLFCWETTKQRQRDVQALNARRLHRSSIDRMLSQSGVWKGRPYVRAFRQKA